MTQRHAVRQRERKRLERERERGESDTSEKRAYMERCKSEQ